MRKSSTAPDPLQRGMKRGMVAVGWRIRASPPEEAFSNDSLAAEWSFLFSNHLTVLTLRDSHLLGSSPPPILTPVLSGN